LNARHRPAVDVPFVQHQAAVLADEFLVGVGDNLGRIALRTGERFFVRLSLGLPLLLALAARTFHYKVSGYCRI